MEYQRPASWQGAQTEKHSAQRIMARLGDDEMTQTAQLRAQLAAMGMELSPEMLGDVKRLYAQEQERLVETVPATARDLPYGPDPRHRLDIYQPPNTKGFAPVLVFVHGGGFLRGDKGDGRDWANANVGRMAAICGFVGVVINYRLAPQHMWPAGPDDLQRVVAWLHENVAGYGGDKAKIVLAGTSAGAVHVAGYVAAMCTPITDLHSDVQGAVLLSGLYGFTDLTERDQAYYGDPALYSQRMPMNGILATRLPLYVACSEHDPSRFQQEFLDLMHTRLERDGRMPRGGIFPGHNHFSLSLHLGTGDRRLLDEISAFVIDCTK